MAVRRSQVCDPGKITTQVQFLRTAVACDGLVLSEPDTSMLPWGFARALATQLPPTDIVARARPNFGFEIAALRLWFATTFGLEHIPEGWDDPMACPPVGFRHTTCRPRTARAHPRRPSWHARLSRARSLDPSVHFIPGKMPCCPAALVAHGIIPAANVEVAWTFICADCGLGPLPPPAMPLRPLALRPARDTRGSAAHPAPQQ